MLAHLGRDQRARWKLHMDIKAQDGAEAMIHRKLISDHSAFVGRVRQSGGRCLPKR